MDGYLFLILQFILLIVLIAGSAFFSSCEMALFSLGRAKVATYKDDPSPAKRRIYFLLDNYNRTLVSIILSNMFVNSCISMLNDTVIHNTGLTGVAATVASAVIGILILLLFGEITPMTLAYVYCDHWSKIVAAPVCLMRTILFPVVWCAEKICDKILDILGRRKSVPLTHEEFDSYIDTCTRNGAFTGAEKELLKETLDFCAREVSEIMLPVNSLGFIRSDSSAKEIRELLFSRKYLYSLVGNKNMDTASQLMPSRDFFALPPERRARWLSSGIVREAVFIPEQATVIHALRTLNAKKIAAALVSDEYGVTVGLISRACIYAALTGNVIGGEKSLPTEPLMSKQNVWLYDGLTPIECVMDDTGWRPEREFESATLNGVFCELAGTLPAKDDEVECDGFRIRILETQGNRASKIEFSRIQNEAEGSADPQEGAIVC